VVSADVKIPASNTGVNTGLSAFMDVPAPGSADNFFGFHGFEGYIRVGFGTSGGAAPDNIRLGVWDYAGSTGSAGSGQGYINPSGVGSAPLAGVTWTADEIYHVSMAIVPITAVEDVNVGKLSVTYSLTDPNGSESMPVTRSVTGISLGLATLQASSPEQFGFYTSSNSGTYSGVFDNFSVTQYVPPPAAVQGDYNGNGVVDAADYVLWRKGADLQNEVADPDVISPEDYTEWRARFGNVSGSALGSGAAVPEPATATLLFCAALAAAAYGRNR
jgi:hypothetical protein